MLLPISLNFHLYLKGHTYVYSIIPFVLLMASNCALIYEIVLKKNDLITRRKDEIEKRKSISISIIVLTFVFIIFTMPSALVDGYFTELLSNESGLFIVLALAELSYTYHAFKFATLFFTNKQIRKEFYLILRHKNRVNTTTAHTAN